MTHTDLINNIIQNFEKDSTSFESVLNLLELHEEKSVIDHVSFRTFDFPNISIDILAVPFVESGYREIERYKYSTNDIKARYYEHTTDKTAPLIYFSELSTYKFSSFLQNTVKELVNKIPIEILCTEKILTTSHPWSSIQHSIYKKIKQESEYAAGIYVNGFKPHHLGVRINHFQKLDSINKLSSFLKENKILFIPKKHSGKSHIIPLIEQLELTLKEKKKAFSDGVFNIPSPGIEFTKRNYYENNKMFMGFLPNISIQKPEPMTLEQINQLILDDN